MNKENGITLVVLVITVIVLLILATVSINLVINNGILDKAKTAVDKYSDGEIEEQIKLAYQEYEMERLTNTNLDFVAYMKQSLEKIYGSGNIDITDENKVFIIEIAWSNGSKKYYLDNGETGICKDIEEYDVQIGDIVYYNELSNGEKSYTTDTSKGIGISTGTKDETTGKYPLNSGTYTTKDLSWRVLGVNPKGQIELISENIPDQLVSVANEEGYLYGPDELNRMCNELYGKGKYAALARNLNVVDVNKLAGVITDSSKKEIDNSYGSKWQYRYPTEEEITETRYMQYRKLNSNETTWSNWKNITNDNYQIFTLPGSSNIISNNNPGKSEEITYNRCFYSISSKITQRTVDGKYMSDILTKGLGTDYITQYLTSRIAVANNLYADFSLCRILNDNLNNYYLFNSNGNREKNKHKIRPVVTLLSDVHLSGNSTDGWTIN